MMFMMLAGRSCAAEIPQLMLMILGAGWSGLGGAEKGDPNDAHYAGSRSVRVGECETKVTQMKLMMLAGRSCAAEMPQLMLIMLGAGCGGC